MTVCLLLLGAAPVDAGSVTLAWDAVPDPAVAGYTILWGISSGTYTSGYDVGTQTQFTVPNLADGTYYFVVRAYSTQGIQSALSNEVTATLSPMTSTPTPTSSCTMADPFSAMGGGTCYQGGWLPPGMPVPGTPSPAPTPTPTPSPTGCITADPFAAIGGGVCYNGGWLPPGMSVPNAPSRAPAPAPVPAPAPSPTGCNTADPFATMGGGTCYQGGWLPPGMPVPGGTPAPAPTPRPAPAPSPAPAWSPAPPSTCLTPDPFATMGGGTCYQGGWLPPGMPIPGGGAPSPSVPPPTPTQASGGLTSCTTADPFIGLPGLVGVCQNGGWSPVPGIRVTGTVTHTADGWTIAGDDGETYTPVDALPSELEAEGLRVFFAGAPQGTQAGLTIVEIFSIGTL